MSKGLKKIYDLLNASLHFFKTTFAAVEGNTCVVVKLDITAETTKILLWTPCRSELNYTVNTPN